MNKQLSSGATIFIIAGVAILALVALGLAGRDSHLPDPGPRTGRMAPPLVGKSVDGKEVNLADFKGKVVLINFWATWCKPCRMELPEIAKIHEKYKDRGLVVLGVAGDETPEPVQKFLKSNPLPFTNVYVTVDIGKGYEVRSLPTSVLIDKTGKVVFDIEAYDPKLDFGTLIEKYL